MKPGKPEKVNWPAYETTRFRFGKVTVFAPGCGAAALQIITNKPYNKIVRLASPGNHWPIKTMLKFLHDNGYETIPLTLGNLVECHSNNPKPRITNKHVILIDQHMNSELSTWSVVYNGFQAHADEITTHSSLDFINFPIDNAYVVWHNKWR